MVYKLFYTVLHSDLFRILAPLLPYIQNAGAFTLGPLPSAETPTKVITVKSSVGNFMTKISCDCDDWDWLEERFRGNRIIKTEIKDLDGDRIVIESPQLNNGVILYVTLE